ncbi:MAG TPA: hypothetical protein PKK00_01025 [Bacteroidales bacterium]|nr:hypothetical protein [Bacteroidales bacterium]HPS16101.1 hypothetical protein [Bacteroidales bacterium]
MDDAGDDNLIVLRAYNFQYEALIDKAKLDSAGIDCFLKNDNMEIIQPFFSQSVGGIKLIIRQSDADLANKILGYIDEDDSQNEIQ